MKIGDILRYSRVSGVSAVEIDGVTNFWPAVEYPGHPTPQLERGINPIGLVKAVDGTRRPAILIRSSPHKAGSAGTPWQDQFNVDMGYVRYYGDAKVDRHETPFQAPGNRALGQEQLPLHRGLDMGARKLAAPLLLFRGVPHEGKQGGYVEFQGVGLIERAELVTQLDQSKLRAFTNVRYDFVVASLAQESEEFDWRWINARRDANRALDECMELAPASWRWWIAQGESAVPRVRRSLSRLRTFPASDQRPEADSKQLALLQGVYNYYSGQKHRFELLAEFVAESLLRRSGVEYMRGWITPPAADGGADFIGRLDVGEGFGRTRIVVLGQAKCERLDAPTGGNHIARTVSRLRRGWIGAYVTTSYFSRRVQSEIIEDEYPILLVNGRHVADAVDRAMFDRGMSNVGSFLDELDKNYEDRVRFRHPSEILLD